MNAKIINVANFKETLSFFQQTKIQGVVSNNLIFFWVLNALQSCYKQLKRANNLYILRSSKVVLYGLLHMCVMFLTCMLNVGASSRMSMKLYSIRCPHTWCILLRLLVKCRQGWKCIETLLTTATGKGGGARCCYVCWGVDCMCSHHYQPLLEKGMQVHEQIRQWGIGTISPNATRWGRSSIVWMLNACASVTLLVKGQVYGQEGIQSGFEFDVFCV